MNKKETKIITNHLIENIPKLTRPIFDKLGLDNPMSIQDKYKYHNLNCILLTEIITFFVENIEEG